MQAVKWIAIALVAGMVFWVWSMWQQAGQRSGQYACEVANQAKCVYDNRFEEWVPR